MRTLAAILGVFLIVSGLFWALQGAGIVRWPAESFMVDTRGWIAYGLVTAAVGTLILWWARRRRRGG